MAAKRRDVSADRIRRVLRGTFGLTRLRGAQETVIGRVLAGLPTLAVMPTGAGKSLCYQLPALLLDGRTVVISPLIALMKDQCDALAELGVPAVRFHSGLTSAEASHARAAIGDGSARIVFTTPEQLQDRDFVAELRRHRVALLVVDEAHCISQWGFDFRPAFLEIEASLQALGKPSVLALTATATEAVAADIAGLLGIPAAGIVTTGLYRPNLRYAVENFSRAEDKLARLTAIVRASSGSALVYAATIKAATEVHDALLTAGEPAGLYHGRLSASARHDAQDAFMDGSVRVMVATNAFGLGIDKPDIRLVLHHQLPPGLDAYYQESGRAGRDGAAADCILLFVDRDRSVQQFFLSGRYPQPADFRAVVDAIAGPQADAGPATAEGLSRNRKTAVALKLLQSESLVQTDDEGRLSLRDGGIDAHALASLADACAARAVSDRGMLERMVEYALSGKCRWQLLLEHLEDTPLPQRCGSCDNCRRMQTHEAESARTQEADGSARVSPTLRFSVGERVRTRRHGQAEVVQSDAISVTVKFDNGQTRSFQPQFLSRAPRPRRAPAGVAA